MSTQFHLLLADDDTDDRFFFDKALKVLKFSTRLTTVDDGEKLMDYLAKNVEVLPDVLFLDLNMPRKNGSECLDEIKQHDKLRHLPVIMYSTSLHEDVADGLYLTGAHYYIRKTGLKELQKMLELVLSFMESKKFDRPSREQFILSME